MIAARPGWLVVGRGRVISRVTGIVLAAATATLVLAMLAPAPAHAAVATPSSATGEASQCSDRFFAVDLGVLPVTVHGRLCVPAASSGAPELEVLVPGATYLAAYWNAPVEGGKYSYVQHATADGFATLALDRLGTGLSSKPLSALVTATGEAQVVHQVISQIRAGLPGAPGFRRIALVGHSLGSLITVVEAATYHDEDAVILTGYSTSIQAAQLLRTFVGGLVPAATDPALHTLDPGYLTTAPGQRGSLFDTTADVDPAVVTWDEATKSVVSIAEVPDALALGLSPAMTRRISVPVLLADGSDDAFFCGGAVQCGSDTALVGSETGDFSPAARLQATVLAGAGHDNSLATNADQFYTAAANWLRGTAGWS